MNIFRSLAYNDFLHHQCYMAYGTNSRVTSQGNPPVLLLSLKSCIKMSFQHVVQFCMAFTLLRPSTVSLCVHMYPIIATVLVRQMASVCVIICMFGTAIMKGRDFYPIDNLRLIKIFYCNKKGARKFMQFNYMSFSYGNKTDQGWLRKFFWLLL
jgi:hypothetical protein